MPWWVKGPEDEEDSLGTFYEDYEMSSALSHFFKLAQEEETADLHWSF